LNLIKEKKERKEERQSLSPTLPQVGRVRGKRRVKDKEEFLLI
jgi:hypothetical protein